MSYAYAQLQHDYESLLPHMVIDGGKLSTFESAAKHILALADRHQTEWDAVIAKTEVPEVWGIGSFERESSSDYTRSPAQGDRWDRKSINVPRGLGPYPNWGASCVAAYHIDHLDSVGKANWTWARAAYEGEIFNGMGYRAHGYHSAYLWAGTNIYNPPSKYTSDGHFVPGARDQQLGLIPMMFTIVRLRPSLALVEPFPTSAPLAPVVPPPAPVPAGMEAHTTAALQAKLGILQDGNYGRGTRRAVATFQKAHGLHVDGLAGPDTWKALDAQ